MLIEVMKILDVWMLSK